MRATHIHVIIIRKRKPIAIQLVFSDRDANCPVIYDVDPHMDRELYHTILNSAQAIFSNTTIHDKE